MVQFLTIFFNFWWFNKGTWISSWSVIMFKRVYQTMNWLLFLLFVCPLWSPTYCFLTTTIFSADYPYINYYVINKSREEAGQFYTDNKVFFSILLNFANPLQAVSHDELNASKLGYHVAHTMDLYDEVQQHHHHHRHQKKHGTSVKYRHQCQNVKNHTVRFTVETTENSVKRLKSTQKRLKLAQKRLKLAPALKN